MKVLVVEDDSNIRRGIVDHFKSQGWLVSEAMDGQLGLEVCSEQAFDVIVLDVMLPQVNGYEICRSVRLEGKTTPIIMLTAKASEEDALQGFNAGATDYVRKPFSLAELTARVRSHGVEEVITRIENEYFILDLNTRNLEQQGYSGSVTLTEKEAQVLALLTHNRGKVMTRDHIMNQVWGNTFMQGTRSVDRCIKTLRKKLQAECIVTIRQVGYMIS